MSAYTTFLAFGGLIGTRETNKAQIDDLPFQLQYKVTTALLFLSCALISVSELVGSNIACHSNAEEDEAIKNLGAFANPYCWITGLYIDPSNYGASNISTDITDTNGVPCVYRENKWYTFEDHPKKCIKRIGYYQWIPYVLLLQGCLFYIPRFIWVVLEEGKLTAMLEGLASGNKKNDKDEDKKKKAHSETANNVVNYIHMTKGGHFQYGMGFLVAHTLLVLNVFVCFCFCNLVLDGDFRMLGLKWISASNGNDISNTVSYTHLTLPTKA